MSDVSLECVQVSNALFKELRSDELAGRMPLLTVGGEDAISKEGFPFFVERLSFTCEEIYVSKPLKEYLMSSTKTSTLVVSFLAVPPARAKWQ